MQQDQIIQIAGTVFGIALVWFFKKADIVTKMLDRFASRQYDNRLNEYVRGAEDLRVIFYSNQKLNRKAGIPRVSYFVAHNCGEQLSKQDSFFVRQQDAWGLDGEGQPLYMQMLPNYGESQHADLGYGVMIDRARVEGMVHYKNIVEDGSDIESGWLRALYKAEGVDEAIVVWYFYDPVTLRHGYASYCRYADSEPFTPQQIQAIITSTKILQARFEETARMWAKTK